MSRGELKNVAEAVTYLRRQLRLSREKFATRVGCSVQTVLRWESGQTEEISEGNLVKLWELSKKHAPVSEKIFAKATQPYRKFLEATAASSGPSDQELKEQFRHRGSDHLASLDQGIRLIQSGDVKKGLLRLRAARHRFSIWKDEVLEEEDLSNKE